jgi:hypothetical protein
MKHWLLLILWLAVSLITLPTFAQTTLVTATGTPTLDGEVSPGEWTSTPLVTAEGVSLNAMADGDYFYLSASWTDKTGTESTQKKQWTFNGASWSQSGDEDRIGFIWNMGLNGADGASCVTMCHIATNEMKTSTGKVDAWHWKSARGNALGFVDDKIWDTTGRHSDSGTSAYQDNVPDVSGLPTFMATGDPGADVDFLVNDAAAQARFDPFGTQTDKTFAIAVAFDAGATFAAGSVIPGYVHRVAEGDRASVESAGKYENGVWTVEFKRTYAGGDNDFDVVPGATVDFTHDIFDNQGGTHALDGSFDATVYTLKLANIPQPTRVDEQIARNILTVFALEQNYPNPFNPSTTIVFSIPRDSYVSLKILNLRGEEVATLIDEQKQPGRFYIDFNASGLSSGVYFYKLSAGDFVEVHKMIFMK